MSYAGTYEACKHGGYDRNCTRCIVERQEARGKRDERGVNHADNGAGYCVGHIEKDPRWPDGDGRCTVLVRHCPVINTPEQVQMNLEEDRRVAIFAAEAKVAGARRALNQAKAELKALENS